MTESNRYYEDYVEISLKEIIQIVLGGWKTITALVLLSVLVAATVSIYVLSPQYEATVTVMASAPTDQLANTADPDSIKGLLDTISSYPMMTIQTYKEQIKNPEVMRQTIEQLNLNELDGSREYTPTSLGKMISLETIPDTNLIAIKVKHTSPELAAKIADAVAENFTQFISSMVRQHASRSSDFIETQIEVERTNLDAALLEMKEFIAQPRGVDELKAELDMRLQQLNDYKQRLEREEIQYADGLLQKELQLKTLLATLQQAESEIEDTPKVLETKQSVATDPLLKDILSEQGIGSTVDLAAIEMRSEEINPNYLTLQSQVSSYKIEKESLNQEIANLRTSYETTKKMLAGKISTITTQVESVQVELAEKDHQEQLLERKVNLAQSNYDAFINKYEETRIAESAEVGDSNIIIVSRAMLPEQPVSPRIMLNIAIALVLGGMLGLFVVFFAAYWKNEDTVATSM